MGGKLSCCKANTPRLPRKERKGSNKLGNHLNHRNSTIIDTDVLRQEESTTNLQHISEREPDDMDCDPSTHPSAGPLFMLSIQRSRSDIRSCKDKVQSQTNLLEARPLKKSSSCSTIFLVDDSTVSHPNLKNTIKCVSLAIYYHIKNREHDSSTKMFEIFDEQLHPLTREPLTDSDREPDHRSIYRFMRTLFNAAQLPPECAIITLVYLERLLTYAETGIGPSTWKRILLGAILLASKVWDDQAVWNVDYCQILRDITVEDMNDLERQFLELLQFNINVPSSVYAKYYFDLRTLADQNDLTFPVEPLSKDRAQRLEAMSKVGEDKAAEMLRNGYRKWSSMEGLSPLRKSRAILS